MKTSRRDYKLLIGVILLTILGMFLLTSCKKEPKPETLNCDVVITYGEQLILPCFDNNTYSLNGDWILVGGKRISYNRDSYSKIDSINYFWIPEDLPYPVNDGYYTTFNILTVGEVMSINDNYIKKNGENIEYKLFNSESGITTIQSKNGYDYFPPLRIAYQDNNTLILMSTGQVAESFFSTEQVGVFEYKRYTGKETISYNYFYTTDPNLPLCKLDYNKLKTNEVYPYIDPDTSSNILTGKWIFESYQYVQPYGSRVTLNDTIEFFTHTYKYKGKTHSFFCKPNYGYMGVNLIDFDVLGTVRSVEVPLSITDRIDNMFYTDNKQKIHLIFKRL